MTEFLDVKSYRPGLGTYTRAPAEDGDAVRGGDGGRGMTRPGSCRPE